MRGGLAAALLGRLALPVSRPNSRKATQIVIPAQAGIHNPEVHIHGYRVPPHGGPGVTVRFANWLSANHESFWTNPRLLIFFKDSRV
jgi:hypothetical protein